MPGGLPPHPTCFAQERSQVDLSPQAGRGGARCAAVFPPSTSLLTSSDSCHNHGSSWLATGRLPEDRPVGGAKERFPAPGLITPPGAATVSPAGATTGASRPGPSPAEGLRPAGGSEKSRGTSAEGRCVLDRKRTSRRLASVSHVPIARHVTVRSQAPCASRRSAPSLGGEAELTRSRHRPRSRDLPDRRSVAV